MTWALLGTFFLNGGLGCSQTCDGHAERRAAHVVQAGLVEEADRGGVTTVLTADAALQFGALATATVDTQLHQLANAFLVEGVERIVGDDLLVDVAFHDGVDIVAAEAEGHLGEVVGAEAEELGHLGDLVGHEGGSRDLDHGAVHVVDLHAELLLDFSLHAVGDGLLVLKFLDVDGQRDHDFQMRVEAFLHQFSGGLEQGAELGLGDFGIDDAEADATLLSIIESL